MAIVEIKGDIIPNDIKWIYDWLKWDATCPNDIRNAIAGMQLGEELEVFINSGGGDVQSGQEMYSLLQSVNSVAKIQSFAASAAGVAAMGCKQVLISDVGTIMIHNVSCSGVSGDYHDMDRASAMLKTLNEIMANAYVEKSGMQLEEVLKLMDRETWLSANGAIEYGFADGKLERKAQDTQNVSEITYTNASNCLQINNAMVFGLRLTEDIKQRVMNEREKQEKDVALKNEILKDLDMYGV